MLSMHWSAALAKQVFPRFLRPAWPWLLGALVAGDFLRGTECRFGKGSGQEEWGIGMDRKRRNCASIEMNHGWDISNTNFPFIKQGMGTLQIWRISEGSLRKEWS